MEAARRQAPSWLCQKRRTTRYSSGASFIVNVATPAKNSVLVSEGAELRLANRVVLLAKFGRVRLALLHLRRHRHSAVYVVASQTTH
jgi:hypothetical protein